jgi:hypothetical protein
METIKEAALKVIEQALEGTPQEGDDNVMAELLGIFGAGVAYAQKWVSIDDELPVKGEDFVAKACTPCLCRIICVMARFSLPSANISSISGCPTVTTGCYDNLKKDLITHWRYVDLPCKI